MTGFERYTDVLKAIDALPDDKTEYNVQMKVLELAARDFLRTRSNTELMDMADDEPSIWDYNATFVEWYEKECDRRSWPLLDSASDRLNDLETIILSNTSGDKSLQYRLKELEKQVAGIQKKVDRIATLLETAKFEISGAQALKL